MFGELLVRRAWIVFGKHVPRLPPDLYKCGGSRREVEAPPEGRIRKELGIENGELRIRKRIENGELRIGGAIRRSRGTRDPTRRPQGAERGPPGGDTAAARG